MSNKPLSYFTNRLGVLLIVIFFGYQLYYSIKNNEKIDEWVILATIGSLAGIVASPNKAMDKKKDEE